MDIVELMDEWKRLEDAFHDNPPSQGETGNTLHGREMCQFLYDNSERIRGELAAYRSLLEETEPVLRAYGEGRLVGNPGVFLADKIREAVEKR